MMVVYEYEEDLAKSRRIMIALQESGGANYQRLAQGLHTTTERGL